MKKILFVILIFLLAGCANEKSENIYRDLDEYLSNVNQIFDVRTNHSTEYYSYYLPSDMQDFDGNSNSAVMKFNNATIIMNLNIASIVNADVFNINYFLDDGFLNKDYETYETSDNFVKNNGETSKYLLKVYEKDDYFLVNIVTDELIFYCTCDGYDMIDAIRHMFTIAASVETDTDKVVTDYSKKDVIEYVKQQVNLFEYDIPSSGLLNELVNQSGGTIREEESSLTPEENNEESIETDDEIDVEEGENDTFE